MAENVLVNDGALVLPTDAGSTAAMMDQMFGSFIYRNLGIVHVACWSTADLQAVHPAGCRRRTFLPLHIP